MGFEWSKWNNWFCLSNINIISELAYNGQKNYLSYIQGESAKINFVKSI